MLVRAKFETKAIPELPTNLDFYVITVFTIKLGILSLVCPCQLKLPMRELLRGHTKIIFLVTVKMLFIFWFEKLAAIFTFGEIK